MAELIDSVLRSRRADVARDRMNLFRADSLISEALRYRQLDLNVVVSSSSFCA